MNSISRSPRIAHGRLDTTEQISLCHEFKPKKAEGNLLRLVREAACRAAPPRAALFRVSLRRRGSSPDGKHSFSILRGIPKSPSSRLFQSHVLVFAQDNLLTAVEVYSQNKILIWYFHHGVPLTCKNLHKQARSGVRGTCSSSSRSTGSSWSRCSSATQQ